MEKDTTAVLQKYVADTGVRSVQKVETDFDRVAQGLALQELTDGLSEALRSEQTPAFEQLVGQSFEQSDAQQRAAVLDRLLDGTSPAARQMLQQQGVLPLTMTSEQAGQLKAALVEQIALVAQQDNPRVIDQISNYYAEEPVLAKTLGGAALNVVLEKIARQR